MTGADPPPPKPERNAFQTGFVALMILVGVLSLLFPTESSDSVRLFLVGLMEQLFFASLALTGCVALGGSYMRSPTGAFVERAGLLMLGGQLLVFGLAVSATPAGKVSSGVFVTGLGVLCIAQVVVITRRIARGRRFVAALRAAQGVEEQR